MILPVMAYAARSKIPSRHANAVQVAHMLCALGPLVGRLNVYLPGGLSHRLRLWSGTWLSVYGRKLPGNARVHFIPDGPEHGFEKHVLAALPETEPVFTRSPWLAWMLAQQDKPVLFESHVASRDAVQTDFTDFIRALNDSRSGAVVAISERIAQEYLAGGLSPERVLIAADGVDVEAFTRPVSGGLGRLFGPAVYERPAMVYTGSLIPEKGAAFLAEAAARLPRLHVVVIGGSVRESARLAAAAPPNLFTHPAVPHKNIPAILHDAAMLVMPYMPTGDLISYMSPLKLFEYLATGRPVLSADLPVLRPFLRHGENSLLFAPGSMDDLCVQAGRILDMTPEALAAMCVRADLPTWENRARTILDWHRVLRKKAGA